MNLTPLTAGKVAGTGTLMLTGQHGAGGTVGGVLISTDGTNAAVVILRENDSSGRIIFDVSSKTPQFPVAPLRLETDKVYYDISGTGASAMLYEWND